MSTEQLSLPLRTAAPKIAERDVDTLLSFLGDGEWHSARWLAMKWQDEIGEPMDDRRIRAIASASAGQVVSWPGSPGYRIFDCVSEEELAHAAEALEHQGKQMYARAAELRRRHHNHALVSRA